jgi:hypothetical protein
VVLDGLLDKVQIYKTLFMDKRPKYIKEKVVDPNYKSPAEIELEK